MSYWDEFEIIPPMLLTHKYLIMLVVFKWSMSLKLNGQNNT